MKFEVLRDMAAVTPKEETQDIECTVCREPFNIPKILPCGHVLCQHCLVAWLKSRPEAKCPSCRYPILDKPLSSDENVADVVDSFPTHLLIAALVEAERLLSKQHVCCVCEDEAAVSLCLNCSDMFCQTCSRMHKKQSVSKHHQVETLSTLTAEVLAAKRSTTCTLHANELVQAYCPTHNVSVCVLCATTDHRHCSHVVKLETRVEQSHAVLTEVATALKSGLDKLDGAITDVEEDIQELDRQTEAGMAEVKAVRRRLEKAVREYCQRLEERMLSMSADLKGQMVDGKATLQKERGRFAMHSHIVQQAEGLSTHGSFSDMMAMMKTRLQNMDCSDDFLTSVRVNHRLTLTIDPQAVTCIEQELSQMGVVSLEDTAKLRENKGNAWTTEERRTHRSSGVGVRNGGDPEVCGTTSELPVLQFHENHGEKIQLTYGGLTAEKTDRSNGDGVVISRDPMMVNRLYEVYLQTIDTTYSNTYVGVVTCSPDAFHVPSSAMDSSSPAVLCVRDDKGHAFGKELYREWPGLRNVKAGTRVGLALNSSRRLHLYVNGQDQGFITTNIPDPCYFMFDLRTRCTKVTALTVRPVHGIWQCAHSSNSA